MDTKYTTGRDINSAIERVSICRRSCVACRRRRYPLRSAVVKKNLRPEIPRKAVYRLSIYLRCLLRLKENGLPTISSEALARAARDGATHYPHERGEVVLREALVAKLARDIAYSDAGITIRETRDLWDMPAVFLLILLLRGAEWLLRRKWGVI